MERLLETARPEQWETTENEDEVQNSDSDHPEIYVGPYQNPRRNRRRNQQPVEDASEEAVGSNDLTSNAGDNNLAPVELDELAVGQYVALDKTEWSNRPLIGLVENIEPTTITVRWLDGSYNGTFRDSYVGSGANRRPWTEDMAKTQIVMIGVQFHQ
ncbi:hypothetical protein OS493_031417 [Desmophyllum pertusum]|uniref:Uncharacterized protein n=1 Tax=Desmophyllum pertusum TaxID=174260 RepID=A0A9W9ZX29_9CNID|nr:hypothetical protein OS493_031417 [Desmophyllum pertusum]